MNIISSLAALLGVSILHTCHADEQFYLSIGCPKKKVQDKFFLRFGYSGHFLAQSAKSAQKCQKVSKASKSAQNDQKVPRVAKPKIILPS